jgi:hypothetical protein
VQPHTRRSLLRPRRRSVNPTICSHINIAGTQNYAADQSYGFKPTPSIFSVSQPTCGNQVSADYIVSPVVANIGIPAFTVHAQACYQT